MPSETGVTVVGDSPRVWQVPSLDRGDAIFGGVSAAVGRELGIDTLWVRAAFVALALVGGWGILLYLGTWAWLAWASWRGLSAVVAPTPKGRDATWRAIGFGCVIAGLAVLFAALPGLRVGVVAGLLIVGLGFALMRRAFVTDGDRTRSIVRTVLLLLSGFGLYALGATLAVTVQFGVGWTTFVIGFAVVVAFAVLAASSPWWWGLVRRADAERQARVRADERAAVGAQLHDSVLQTLALIQNQTDPSMSAQLARRQERELRNWLEPDRLSRQGSSLKGQLDMVVADVEQLYSVRVDTVVVGDVLLTAEVEALIAATREAIVNSAKHSGAAEVDVFAEVTERSVEVFVRDRGVGFDVATQPERIGIRDSIRGRMARIGGDAAINAEPGEGTEVELRVPRLDHERGGL